MKVTKDSLVVMKRDLLIVNLYILRATTVIGNAFISIMSLSDLI
jgi:hypothetical protein